MEFLTTSIKIFGVKWYFMAIIVYLLSTLLVTEVVKKLIYFILDLLFRKRKFEKIKKTIQRSNLIPILLSWMVGVGICLLIKYWQTRLVNTACIIQFAFLTILLNGGYKIIRRRWKTWNKLKGNSYGGFTKTISNVARKIWPKRKK